MSFQSIVRLRGRLSGMACALLLAGCATTAPPSKPSPEPSIAPTAPTPPAPIAKRTAPIEAFVATAAAREAFRRACPRLLKRGDASGLTRQEDWQAPCADTDADPQRFFTRHFTPVRLGDGKGLATGYFEPSIRGYPTAAPGAAPIYKRPPELVDISLKDWGIEGGTIRGFAKDGRVFRAPDRAAIEKGALANRSLELGWAADPVDLFFLHIQGSGRLVMPDSSSFRIGYDGQNGHGYVAIGKLLKDRGILQKAGMAEIRQWLAANPEAGVKLMQENPSYIFLRRLPDSIDGPVGALGVPLLAEANAAADASTLALGTPVWIDTMVDGQPYRRLLIASDTGGAIKGANRFDIFFGAGDEAGRKAGALASPLNATLLLPNAAAARLAP